MKNSFYARNRHKLINALQDADYIIIGGNALLSRSADVALPFRQDSNMLYFTGVKVPSSSLFIDIKNGKHYLVLPKPTKVQIIFEDLPNINELLKNSGCDGIIDYNQLKKSITTGAKVYFSLPPKSQQHNLFSNPFRQWLKAYLSVAGMQDLRAVAAKLRMVKQLPEIENIKNAVMATKQTLDSIQRLIWTDGMTEQELEWRITAEFSKKGLGHAYPPIIAAGLNAAILHHLPTQKKLAKSKMVLLDVGAEYNNYAADISRTFTKGTDSIYDDLLDAQKEIIKFVKPGILLKDVHNKAVDLLSKVASKNKLSEPIDRLFPHSIGHHLGLDVHDAADYSVPLAENMVITVEPGLYSKSLGFGYRVEDDILVTKNGSILL